MPSQQKPGLPELYGPQEVEFLDVPADLIEHALQQAGPAIRRLHIGEYFTHRDTPSTTLGTKILISEPPYDTVQEGNLRSVSNTGVVTINFPAVVGRLGRFDLFARATDKELLDKQIEEQHKLREQKQSFIDENPLGKAGLLLNNRFGGVDIDNPEQTSRHLIMRLAIARQAELGSLEGMMQLDLIDPTIGNALEPELTAYFESVGKIADAVSHLPDGIKATTGSALLEGAIELGRQFVADNRDRITLATRIIQDPTFSRTVVGYAALEDKK